MTDRRAQLLATVESLKKQRRAMAVGHPQRRHLGAEIARVNLEIGDLRKGRPHSIATNYASSFELCARRMLAPEVYDTIAAAAQQRMQQEEP